MPKEGKEQLEELVNDLLPAEPPMPPLPRKLMKKIFGEEFGKIKLPFEK